MNESNYAIDPSAFNTETAVATAKFVANMAGWVVGLHGQNEAQSREISDLAGKLEELTRRHEQCMKVARGDQLRRDYLSYQSIPDDELHEDVRVIKELRESQDKLRADIAGFQQKTDQAQVSQKIAETDRDNLLKLLYSAARPESQLLRTTRRAIQRIIDRHRKAG